MYVMNYQEREEKDVDMQGVVKTKVRWLVGRRSGAKTYAMRMFRMEVGGIIPLHTHTEEHQIFIIEGEAKLLSEEGERIAKKDDVVFIPSEMLHGYDNRDGKGPFRFICVIPLIEK